MALSQWIVTTSILCSYGFFKEIRPSEPFLTEYLIGPHKNLSIDVVYHEVYPVWTYSYLVALIPVFLLTDLLKYKPVIILEAVTYIATWGLLLWAQGVLTMQIMQFMYGLATATEIAYYSYIYAVVDSEHYRTVTSMTRGFILTGRFVAGFLGQLIVSLHWASYFVLNCISMGCVMVALVISFFLPPAKKSVYFHDPATPLNETSTESETDDHENDQSYVQDEHNSTLEEDNKACSEDSSIDNANIDPNTVVIQPDGNIEETPQTLVKTTNCCHSNFLILLLDFKHCYTNTDLLKWSIWWAIATCGFLQAGNYIQTLWEHIHPDNPDATIYNGAVEAAATLAGAVLAFLLALFKVNWAVFGELFLGIVSVGEAIMLGFMAKTSSIWAAYILYIGYKASYQLAITVTSFQIASSLRVERYALVFGCNMFIALVLQTIFTAIVVDKRGLHLDIVTEFLITAGYYLLMGLVFLIKALVSLSKMGWRQAWSRRCPESASYSEF